MKDVKRTLNGFKLFIKREENLLLLYLETNRTGEAAVRRNEASRRSTNASSCAISAGNFGVVYRLVCSENREYCSFNCMGVAKTLNSLRQQKRGIFRNGVKGVHNGNGNILPGEKKKTLGFLTFEGFVNIKFSFCFL